MKPTLISLGIATLLIGGALYSATSYEDDAVGKRTEELESVADKSTKPVEDKPMDKPIKDKLTVTDHTDKIKMVRESVEKDAGEIEIILEKTRPAVELKKWDGEAAMTVVYEKVDGDGSLVTDTDRVEWKDSKGKEEVHAYPLPPAEGMEDGGFEIEVILNEKPDTNIFDFKIEGADELDFFYQPALTQQEIDEGIIRPENVIGSYAVYHKTKANHKIGETNYGTGKAYHIYRPKAFDADGVEQWAELSYANGVLTVTVPQEWLDKAKYPVRVDPTIGYTSLGTGGNINLANEINDQSYQNGDTVSLLSSGILSSLTYGLSGVSSAASIDLRAAVFRKDDPSTSNHTLVTSVEELNKSISVAAAFYTFSTSAVSLSADDYIIAILGNGDDLTVSQAVSVQYDVLTGSGYFNDGGIGPGLYATLAAEAPWAVVQAGTFVKLSVYATYIATSTVSTLTTSANTPRAAILNATTTDASTNALTQHGFAYGTNSSLSGGDTATTTLGALSSNSFTQTVSNLTPNTTYYYRAYATNAAGTGFGSILSFTTPTVSTQHINSGTQIINGGTLRVQ